MSETKEPENPEVPRWNPKRPRDGEIALDVGSVLEMMEDRARGRQVAPGAPTGLPSLEELLGPLQPEQLLVLAGAPAVGKTSLALLISAHAAAVSTPVLYVSPDMSRFELLERLLASRSKLDSQRLRRGHLEYSEWKNVLYPAGNELAALPLRIDDHPTPSLGGVEAAIVQFLESEPVLSRRAQGKPEVLVVVDSLHMIEAPTRGETAEREIAEVARALKKMSRAHCLPILVTSSLNRNLERRDDRRPQLSDLRGSGVIENSADVVLFLAAADVYAEAPSPFVDLIIAKNRTGRTGTLRLRFARETGTFEAAPDLADEPY